MPSNSVKLNVFGVILGVLLMGLMFTQAPLPAFAQAAQDASSGRRHGHNNNSRRQRFCSNTAGVQLAACRNEVMDDFYTENAICIQIPETDERKECFDDAVDSRKEGNQLCKEQFDARRDLCGLIGEERYYPDFDPELFDDDFTNLTNPNPYYPLAIGNMWEYESEDEVSRVVVLDETKLIEGVTCIVVNDVVENDEGGKEDTNDWIAHRKDGTEFYCGEESKDFETFPGDMPQIFELVSIEGSFKAGRDGDLPGVLFLFEPTVGTTYRQEYSLGNAEDAATVLSINYSYGNDPELDEFVPEDLADIMCGDNSDCVVTGEFTPIEPDVYERKYYAKDIGLFLEVNPEDGAINELVGCNFGGKCNDL